MAPGPPPKDPRLRQRRNKTSTAAKLSLVPTGIEVPDLPERTIRHPETGEPMVREWHPRATEFWADIWESPMAPEFLKADHHGLYILLTLVDAYWRRMDDGQVTGANELAKEIRMQRQCFGLTPVDRRRLQWEVERVEQATEKKSQRRKAKTEKSAKRGKSASDDPSQHLAAVT